MPSGTGRRWTGRRQRSRPAALSVFVPAAVPFVSSQEVGERYERRGVAKPVSAVTGLGTPYALIGPLRWFVKTDGALNVD